MKCLICVSQDRKLHDFYLCMLFLFKDRYFYLMFMMNSVEFLLDYEIEMCFLLMWYFTMLIYVS